MPGLFPRHLRLIVGDESGEGVDLGRLSATFQVERTSSGGIGLAKVAVFNLSETTLSTLMERFTRIRLEAGYAQRSGTIFQGEIRNVFARHDGPDKLVEIFAADAASAWADSNVNLSFGAGTRLRDIVRAVATTFEGVSVGSLDYIEDQTISGGWVASGMTRREMRKLAESFGFRWSIQGGVFQAIDLLRPPPAISVEVSRDTGMIASPIASSGGVEVLTLLNHAIVPGRRINVITAGSEIAVSARTLQQKRQFRLQVDGEFEVLRTLHVGETRGQTWYTKAFAIRTEGV